MATDQSLQVVPIYDDEGHILFWVPEELWREQLLKLQMIRDSVHAPVSDHELKRALYDQFEIALELSRAPITKH